jgi:hypothetical protein
MKKCKFCTNSGYTEEGKLVCTKYLLYVGEDKFEKPCSGFKFNLNNGHLVIAAAISVVTMILIMCGL